MSLKKYVSSLGIAFLCFGYFASYIPYSMMTKMITKGLFAGQDGVGFSGFEIQAVAVFGSTIAMYAFISILGWWKYATQWKCCGISLPRPRWFTLVAGICIAIQIITTTLAYTFEGVSIVFAMLLMRGGVLLIAPVLDVIVKSRKRKIYWPSWFAAGLSFGALLAAFFSKGGTGMTVICAIDIIAYLSAYFIILYFMSSRAKSDDMEERKGYFTEQQMIATPVLLVALFIVGLFGSFMDPSSIPGKIWSGFVEFPFQGFFWYTFIIGIFSSGAGFFGTLIYLDARENTFTVPANRSASIVAGVIATYLLAIFYGQRYPDAGQLIGVALIIGAIFFLAYRASYEKKQNGLVKKTDVKKVSAKKANLKKTSK